MADQTENQLLNALLIRAEELAKERERARVEELAYHAWVDEQISSLGSRLYFAEQKIAELEQPLPNTQ